MFGEQTFAQLRTGLRGELTSPPRCGQDLKLRSSVTGKTRLEWRCRKEFSHWEDKAGMDGCQEFSHWEDKAGMD